MNAVKAELHLVADSLPDNATYEDAMNELYTRYVREKFEQGSAQIKEGKGIPHSEVEKIIRSWRK